MKSQIKENKSTSIKKLKESDFSVTNFTKDLSYGKKHEKLVMKSLENFELKTDRMAHKTGNVYVEFKSRGKESRKKTRKATMTNKMNPTAMPCSKISASKTQKSTIRRCSRSYSSETTTLHQTEKINVIFLIG